MGKVEIGYQVTHKEPKKPAKPIFEKDRIIPRVVRDKKEDDFILNNGGNGWK